MPLFLLFGNPKSVKIRAYSKNKGGKNKGISTVSAGGHVVTLEIILYQNKANHLVATPGG